MTNFKKFISSLLFGRQIFVHLYSIHIDIVSYLYNMCHCKVTNIQTKKKMHNVLA